jgi:hypothetical protein
MNVNSVAAQSLYLQELSSQNNPALNAGSVSSSATSDGADLSNPAQFFSELKQLSTQDPSAFKSITSQIAQQLTTAAQSSTDPNQAALFNSLAANFQSASQTGNFSSLFPQSQAQSSAANSSGTQPQSSGAHHHGHHHRGYAQASTSTDSSTQDTLSSILSNYGKQVESLLSASSTAATTPA